MRLPRMTTRRWMVAVAVIAVLLNFVAWLWRRSVAFQARADWHARRLALPLNSPVRHSYDEDEMQRAKYERAARYPWLPVEPDPPEPE